MCAGALGRVNQSIEFCYFINRQQPLATHCACAQMSIRPIQVEVTNVFGQTGPGSGDVETAYLAARQPHPSYRQLSEGLAQGPYVAAGGGVEPAIFRTDNHRSTNHTS